MEKNIKLMLLALSVILIDQISKAYAGGIVKNTGCAFGLLQGNNWLFAVVSFVVIVLVFYYYAMVKGYGFAGLGFLLGGATSNLVDRMAFGYVRDFIFIGIWPAFNIADAFNVLGVLLVVLWLARRNKANKKIGKIKNIA